MNRTYKLEDFTISYTDNQKKTIPIIFIHGFPFDKSSWEPQVKYFKKFYRVITFDLRGFGESGIGNKATNIDLYADDIIAFMDGLNIPKAIICGLSMGGYIALNIIERYPDRVTALILADTQCLADSPEAKEKRFATIKNLEVEGHSKFADEFIKNIFTNESLSDCKALTDKVKKIILSNSIESIICGLKALATRRETCSILPNIKSPVLVICGEEDKLTPPEKSIFLHQQVPNSILKIIDNAAHMSNLEQADIFNITIRGFLNNVLA